MVKKSRACLLMVFFLTAAAGLMSSPEVRAEGMPVTLSLKESIDSYDVTGDGIKDKIEVRPTKKKDGYESGWKIFINGTEAYRQKGEYVEYLTVMLWPVNDTTTYVDIADEVGANDDVSAHGLYVYQGGTLKQTCNLYDPIVRCINNYHFQSEIVELTEDRMTVECYDQLASTGGIRWRIPYELKNGKWTPKTDTYSLVKGSTKTRFTVSKKFIIYKKAGGKRKVATVRKGAKVRLLGICQKKKQTYVQVRLSSGKKGWYRNPKKIKDWSYPAYFKEVQFAG